MQLTPEQEAAVMEMVADSIANRLWAKLESIAEEIPCVTINRACGILDLTPQQVNKVIEEFVDFGARDRRLSLAQLRRLVASRTVKAGSRKKRR